MLLSGCCAVSETPAVWRVEAHQQRALVLRAVGVAQLARPDPAGGAVLGDLLEEVDVRVEEERQPRRELVHVEAALDRVLHVGEAVLQRERQLLLRRRARLADVVAGDRDRVPARHPLEQNSIMSVTSRIAGSIGKHHSFWAMYSLRMSVWIVPASCSGGDALALGGDDVEREHHRRRRVDRHRGRHLAHRDAARTASPCRRACRSPRPRGPPRPRSADGPSRGPSATACRTPSRARSGRGRAGSGSARSSPPRCRSPRTGASSRAGRGTSTGTPRA